MGARCVLALAPGHADAALWSRVLQEEAPVSGQPAPCAECPLRRGGECGCKAGRLAAEKAAEARRAWLAADLLRRLMSTPGGVNVAAVGVPADVVEEVVAAGVARLAAAIECGEFVTLVCLPTPAPPTGATRPARTTRGRRPVCAEAPAADGATNAEMVQMGGQLAEQPGVARGQLA